MADTEEVPKVGKKKKRKKKKKDLNVSLNKPVGVDQYKEGLGAPQRSGRPEACSRPRARLGGVKAGNWRWVTRDPDN